MGGVCQQGNGLRSQDFAEYTLNIFCVARVVLSMSLLFGSNQRPPFQKIMTPIRNRNAQLSSSANQRLAAYSATTLAGALSITSSDAAIVYTNNNNALLVDTVTTDGSFASYSFDLNDDAVQDFRLWTRDNTGSSSPWNNDAALSAPLGAGLTVDAVGVLAGSNYPARLSAGATIDGSAAFVSLPQFTTGSNPGWLADGDSGGAGFAASNWIVEPNNTGYLGLRFKISGDDHYAWVRITVNPQSTRPGTRPRSIIVHEWAYENVAGDGIVAGAGVIPEPTSLGLLALGSLGLASHRRRRQNAA